MKLGFQWTLGALQVPAKTIVFLTFSQDNFKTITKNLHIILKNPSAVLLLKRRPNLHRSTLLASVPTHAEQRHMMHACAQLTPNKHKNYQTLTFVFLVFRQCEIKFKNPLVFKFIFFCNVKMPNGAKYGYQGIVSLVSLFEELLTGISLCILTPDDHIHVPMQITSNNVHVHVHKHPNLHYAKAAEKKETQERKITSTNNPFQDSPILPLSHCATVSLYYTTAVHKRVVRYSSTLPGLQAITLIFGRLVVVFNLNLDF